MVVFLCLCFCGGVFLVVFLVFLWCVVVRWRFCGGVFVLVFLWWCFFGGVLGVFVVVFCGGCGGVVVVFLWWCF